MDFLRPHYFLLAGKTGCAYAAKGMSERTALPFGCKRQLVVEAGDEDRTAATQFYALAAAAPHRPGQLTSYRLHTKMCDRTSIRALLKGSI